MTSFAVSDRGFRHYDPIATNYGHEVRVYESSAASKPCLWLDVTLTADVAQKVPGIKPESATAHLTLDQARAIRDALNTAIADHYQVRS